MIAPAVDTTLGPWVVDPVRPDFMKDMAEILTDPNPIHLDPAAAAAAGLGDRVINQGPTGLGYVLNMLHEELPGATVIDLRVRMTANVHGGDRVSAAGRVTSVTDEPGRRRIGCEVWLDVDGAARALTGTATLLVPDSYPHVERRGT